MSDVGYISFDLVIRSNLEEQLEKMRAEAQKPAQKLGEAISKNISESMAKTDISMPKIEISKPEIPKFDEAMEVPKIEVPQVEVPKADTSAFEQSAEEINEIVQRAVDRMNKPVIEAEVVTESPRPVNTKAYIEYDPIQIQAEIDQKLKEPIDSLNKEIKEKLGGYEIPADPVEALREEINNTYFKLDLLQKKWQELSAAEPTDKVCSQLQSVQQQVG